jgi:ribulose-phosphate 3-epimerase
MAGRPGGSGRKVGSAALIVPSILSADFNRLGEQVREAVDAGADRIQVDVMDGHFVPNFSMGPQFVAAVKRVADVPVEAHLMVERPELFVAAFVKAGADVVIVQVESTYSLYRVVHSITEAGARAAVALNPGTPVESLREIAPYVSEINVMTVEPGFGGQKFIDSSPAKIRRVRELAPNVEIEVDGGIDPDTAPLCVAAGASVLVAGSAVFGHPDGPGAGIGALRSALG